MKTILVVLLSLWFCTPIFAEDGQTMEEKQVEADSSDSNTADQRSYFELDFGVPVLFAPANSYRKAYSDADLSLGIRVAGSYTWHRFRAELGYLYQNLKDGNPDISAHNGRSVRSSESEMKVHQTEMLFFWLKNEKNRVAFIGGGPVSLYVKENFDVTYRDNRQSHSFRNSTSANGYKLVVGGKDNDSMLKTTFSYTHAFVDSEYGKKYNLGGYAFTFHISFSGL